MLNHRTYIHAGHSKLTRWLAGLMLALCASISLAEAEAPKERAVLITGASSGSGRAMTESLSQKGFHVYAGARKAADLKALDALDNVTAVRLDVTVSADIEAAVQQVTQAGRGLFAVVNNAGVGLMAPLIELEESDLDFIFDVNVYGPYRITRAFAPLLIESRGRVVNIGSIAGVQTRTFYGPYSMSKHALEAFNDALAIELERFGVTSTIVDPGGFRSNIGKNIQARLSSRGVDIEGSLYREDWERNWVVAEKGDITGVPGPELVADVVEDVLLAETPRRRYMTVGDAGRAENTMRALLRRMVEFNRDQAFSYTEEELAAMLAEEYAAP